MTTGKTGVSFTVTVALDAEGPFPTFKEALSNFINRMKTDDRTRSLMIVETGCWIERLEANTPTLPLYFYDARDFGFRMGLLVGTSDFNEKAPEPNPDVVQKLFIQNSFGPTRAEEFINTLPVLEFA